MGAGATDPSVRWLAPIPELDEPTLVAVLNGWIDAGGAARAAAEAIEDDAAASPIAEFDDDVYVDYRARRPIMELRDGLNSVLNWERITLTHGRDQTGRDVLLLTGPVPLVPYRQPGTADLPAEIVRFARDYDAFLLANHGVTTVGRSLDEALHRMESLEQGARIILAARQLGRVNELPPEAAAALRSLREESRGAQ